MIKFLNVYGYKQDYFKKIIYGTVTDGGIVFIFNSYMLK